MKQYTVYFSEPVKHTYTGDRFNKELKKWEYGENVRNGKIRSHFILLLQQRN